MFRFLSPLVRLYCVRRSLTLCSSTPSFPTGLDSLVRVLEDRSTTAPSRRMRRQLREFVEARLSPDRNAAD